jgi:hypothetical protein
VYDDATLASYRANKLEVVAADAATIEIVATPELSDVYVNAPELLDVGAVIEKDASDNTYTPDFGPSVNAPKVGSAAFTVRVVLTLELLYVASAACVAVIVLVPAPTMVTVLDEIVATAVFEDEYVNAPVLFDDGAVRLNDASVPYVFVEIASSAPIVGTILFIVVILNPTRVWSQE